MSRRSSVRSKGYGTRRPYRRCWATLPATCSTKSYEYNQEHPNNEAIIKEIKRMSDYRISVDEDALSLIKSEYKQAPVRSKKPLYANKKNGKNNKGPQRHNYSK